MKLDAYTLRHVASEYSRRARSHRLHGFADRYEVQQAEYWRARAKNLDKRRKLK